MFLVSQGQVRDIIYRGTQEQIQQAVMPDGKVPLVRPLSASLFWVFFVFWTDLLVLVRQLSRCPVHVRLCLQVSGPVFFSRSVSEKLLHTHVTPPLDGCTYLGLDSGAPPLQVTCDPTVPEHLWEGDLNQILRHAVC